MRSTTASHQDQAAGRLRGFDANEGPAKASKKKKTKATGRGSLDNAGLRLAQGSSGDHVAIQQMLTRVLQGPTASEFQAQLEHPQYEPTDRWVVKHDRQLVAHLRLQPREMQFGQQRLPTAAVADVATMMEYRNQGCGSALLQTAERQMRKEGAVLGVLRTQAPAFYARHGWVVCGRHCYSCACPRSILSYLQFRRDERRPKFALSQDGGEDALNIRLWRHVELAALTRLHSQYTATAFGAWHRTDAVWRWLISRRGYDRIYVAIEGPDKLNLDDALDPIVGYAVTREGRIVELVTAADHPTAREQLLARACGDAIERDHHSVRIDAPPDDPVHTLIQGAGGKYHYHEAECGDVIMIKLLDPTARLAELGDQLQDRARQADLPRPTELGFLVGNQKFQLVVGARRIKLNEGKLGRSYLSCSPGDLVRLIMGHLDVIEAVASKRLVASTRVALDASAALFPRQPLWFPPLDDLPSV